MKNIVNNNGHSVLVVNDDASTITACEAPAGQTGFYYPPNPYVTSANRLFITASDGTKMRPYFVTEANLLGNSWSSGTGMDKLDNSNALTILPNGNVQVTDASGYVTQFDPSTGALAIDTLAMTAAKEGFTADFVSQYDIPQPQLWKIGSVWYLRMYKRIYAITLTDNEGTFTIDDLNTFWELGTDFGSADDCLASLFMKGSNLAVVTALGAIFELDTGSWVEAGQVVAQQAFGPIAGDYPDYGQDEPFTGPAFSLSFVRGVCKANIEGVDWYTFYGTGFCLTCTMNFTTWARVKLRSADGESWEQNNNNITGTTNVGVIPTESDGKLYLPSVLYAEYSPTLGKLVIIAPGTIPGE